MTERFFGPKPWGMSIDRPEMYIKDVCPIGMQCAHCLEPILLGESGSIMDCIGVDSEWSQIVYHAECRVRLIVGSVGHQLGKCGCNGGPDEMDDPPDVSLKEGAKQAVVLFAQQQAKRLLSTKERLGTKL